MDYVNKITDMINCEMKKKLCKFIVISWKLALGEKIILIYKL